MSRFSTYGKGYLTEQEFFKLYKEAACEDLDSNGRFRRSARSTQSSVQKVWRDFTAHSIQSPNEIEWERKKEQIKQRPPSLKSSTTSSTLIDECEILEWKQDNALPHWTIDSQGVANLRRSSHEIVEMCSDGETPKRIRDGQFGKNCGAVVCGRTSLVVA